MFRISTLPGSTFAISCLKTQASSQDGMEISSHIRARCREFYAGQCSERLFLRGVLRFVRINGEREPRSRASPNPLAIALLVFSKH